MSELEKCPICRGEMQAIPKYLGGWAYMCDNEKCEAENQEIGVTLLHALNTRKPEPGQPAAVQLCEGLMPVDPALLEDFKKTMQNETIPAIIDAVRARQKAAAEYGLPKPAAGQSEPSVDELFDATLKDIANEYPDDRLHQIWLLKGGNFHGPNIETGTMPQALLFEYLREIYTHPIPAAPAVPEGWKFRKMDFGIAITQPGKGPYCALPQGHGASSLAEAILNNLGMAILAASPNQQDVAK